MEEDGEHDEEETPTSPFWLQTTTNLSRIQRYRRRISTLFFNSGVFIVFLLLFALLSILFIIPPLIHFSYHFLTPKSFIKKGWDSINFILVLIALAFGFLARNINNDEKLSFENGFDRSAPESSTGAPIMSPATSTNPQWYDFNDQPVDSVNGLRRQRASSSYPDLRELSPPPDHRFSDDTHLHYYRNLESNRHYLRQRTRLEDNAYGGIPPENGLHFQAPEPPCLPPPAPPQTAAVKKKMKRISYNVSGESGEGSRRTVAGKIWSPEIESSEYNGRKRGDGERRRRARSSEPRKILSPVIAPVPESSSPAPISPLTKKGFFTSFYHKKKKRPQRHRSVDNLYSLLNQSQPPPARFQPPPAPAAPPPPPPPPSALHKKKIITFAPTSTAPPPPPPPRRRTELRPPSAAVTRVAPFLTEKPRGPLSTMMSSFNAVDDSSSGGDSPMKNIPAPPPPPFKMPDWKFAVEGDFVRLLSSRSVSPSSDVEASPPSAVAEVVAPPSSDVDDKADSFIARFRAELKLEKINSFSPNQNIGMSKLGPGPLQGPNDY